MKNKIVLLLFFIASPFHIFAPEDPPANNLISWQTTVVIGTLCFTAGLITTYFFKDKIENLFNSQTGKELSPKIEYVVNKNTRTNTIRLYPDLSNAFKKSRLMNVKKSSSPYY